MLNILKRPAFLESLNRNVAQTSCYPFFTFLKVMLCLHPDLLSIDHFAERILRLPPRLVTPLVQNPIPWPAAKNHERFVYSAMARYLGLPTDRLVVDLDTKEVAKDVLKFLREHGISTTDFASKVVRLQRATLNNYLVRF